MSTASQPSPGAPKASALPKAPVPDLAPVPKTARGSRWRAVFPLPAGKELGVLVLAVLTLAIPVAVIELPVIKYTHGNVLFPLDSAYVNITVGRNLAFYQVWGLSKFAFQSAASSLLYPVTLAPIFFILGAHLVIPLIVNFLAGAYFLLMLQRSLIRHGLNPVRQFLALLGATALTLLPLLVVSGMEYTLQLLFVFLFIDSLVEVLARPAEAKSSIPVRVYIFALLAVAAHYEDLFVILLACLLVPRKKATILAAIAASPILVFGIISLFKKSHFLPNAMLLGPYPAYVVVLAILAVGTAAWLILKRARSAPIAILVLLSIPFTTRNAANLAGFQKNCEHIYDNQYPAAGFVHLYYYKSTVGTNEPGAVSYFSEGRKLDLENNHSWSPLYADSLTKKEGVRIAIVKDPWFSPDQLPKWTRIASWAMPNKNSVTFYAINKYDTTRLRKNLQDYQHLLPAGVAVRYY